ncbi:MAG: hypothetical protein M1118_02170 [Chloroflexi bacterium]|nr:hypothetical protein [Chloroflexota bacterium]
MAVEKQKALVRRLARTYGIVVHSVLTTLAHVVGTTRLDRDLGPDAFAYLNTARLQHHIGKV